MTNGEPRRDAPPPERFERVEALRATAAGRVGVGFDRDLEAALSALGVTVAEATRMGELASRGALPGMDRGAFPAKKLVDRERAYSGWLANWVDTARSKPRSLPSSPANDPAPPSGSPTRARPPLARTEPSPDQVAGAAEAIRSGLAGLRGGGRRDAG